MTDDAIDLVSVVVPKRYLTKVYGYIAALDDASSTGSEGGAGASENGAAKETTWTPELIRRQYHESPEIIKQFQRLLASRSGEWLSTSEIAKTLNAKHGSKTIAGALGAYGRRTSNRYKMKTWPFVHRWLHAEGQQSYSMAPEVAEIINSLQG